MNLLQVDSVMKSFGMRQVLTDVFLTCRPGEVIGMLGRNGSGKSTLLKIIFGALEADQKYVVADGKRIYTVGDTRKMISYLPQHHFLPGHLETEAVLNLFCAPERLGRACDHEYFRRMKGKKCRQLSGGEKRFLEIFLVIHGRSRYVLLDEPFSGIAPVVKEEIKTWISEQSRDKGFLITDHDYRNIMDVSTRLILLRDGGTRAVRGPEELIFLGYLPDPE